MGGDDRRRREQPGDALDPVAHREKRGRLPGNRYVRVLRPFFGKFQRRESSRLVATEGVFERRSRTARALESAWRRLVGARLPNEMEIHERISTFKGLAVFASDNISSSAYATEEIMRVLVLAGAGALALTMPITVVIGLVLVTVVTSYQQTIAAYPTGGGSYIVASDNLGPVPGLVAGASLLTDYALTVAVSVAAGVEALTSVFPTLYADRVELAVLFVLLICLGNLRGIRESGTIFAAPTYIYLVAIFGLLAVGFVRLVTGTLPSYVPPASYVPQGGLQALGLVLILRAFSSGSVALTGVEAVSNGVPAFTPPEPKHAQRVLVLMAGFFVSIFVGISFLAGHIGIVPDPTEQKSVISQLAAVLVGNGSAYHYLVQISTAVLLVLAANTGYSDFPRLSSILARDRYWPRQFQYRGDRLAFSTGILVLTALSIALLLIFHASVTALIPLYTIGVFVAFTLSQSGMVRRWYRLRGDVPSWRRRAAVNGLGAVATGVVAVIVAASKFVLGAWVVLVLVPFLVAVMLAIHRHYEGVEAAMEVDDPEGYPADPPARVIVPVSRLNRSALRAVRFAQSIAEHPVVVHVSDDTKEAEEFNAKWAAWHLGMEPVVIESPYRSLIPPLLAYIDAIREAAPERSVLIVLPEFVPRHFWQYLLHNQAALRLKMHLFFRSNTIVVDIPTHLGAPEEGGSPPSAARVGGGGRHSPRS